MSKSQSCRLSSLAVFVWLMIAAPMGCRSRAQSDLYRQKMASEIRVLEDQLYDADYENRVLRDRIERERLKKESAEARSAREPIEPAPAPARKPSSPSQSVPRPESAGPESAGPESAGPESPRADRAVEDRAKKFSDDLPDADDLQLPEMDAGVPVDSLPLIDPGESPAPPKSTPSPQEKAPQETDPSFELLPAPSGPQPPGKEDTEMDQVIPGELLPPPLSPEEIKPPGQIQLPDSVQASNGIPASLRIHRSLSGGHRIDDQLEGLMVVVNVVDALGKTVDLSRFDVEGELSIVVLDPSLDPSQARIGRWDFTGPQIASLVRSEPISGIHLPLDWQQVRPSGDEVIVHARLRGDEDEMRCEQRIRVERKPGVAQWTPRGTSLK